ncbi:hypothetical protein C7212DRAFT_328056, partial [Tuber magnatum]
MVGVGVFALAFSSPTPLVVVHTWLFVFLGFVHIDRYFRSMVPCVQKVQYIMVDATHNAQPSKKI